MKLPSSHYKCALLDRITSHAQARPRLLACIDSRGEMFYEDLVRESSQLATRLRSEGIGPDDIVSIHIVKSCEFVVAALAVLRAGAAFLPIDISYPEARRLYMIQNSRTALVITDATRDNDPPLRTGAKVLPWKFGQGATHNHDVEALGQEALTTRDADSSAYIIYTSGTTGKPKGVVVAQRNLDHLGSVVDGWLGAGPGSRMLLNAPVSFDANVIEVVTCMVSGATAVIDSRPDQLGEGLVATLNDNLIDLVILPPAAMEFGSPDGIEYVSNIISAGDILRPDIARRWLSKTGDYRLHNAYGPTETTVIASIGEVLDPAVPNISVGAAVAGVTIHILDENLRPVHGTTVGEVYIAGGGVARGYLYSPALTACTFVADPFANNGSRMYRTGDMGRWTANRQLQFEGRSDRQVELSGFRVELAEIEATIAEVQGITQTVVVPDVDNEGRIRGLAAFFVASRMVPLAAVRAHMKDCLPDYMLPDLITQVPSIPTTPAGKRDNRRLLSLVAGQLKYGHAERGDSPLATVLAVWREVLEVDVAPDEDFVLLGGNSVKLVQLSRLLEKRGVRLSVRELMENSTARRQADVAARKAARDPASG